MHVYEMHRSSVTGKPLHIPAPKLKPDVFVSLYVKPAVGEGYLGRVRLVEKVNDDGGNMSMWRVRFGDGHMGTFVVNALNAQPMEF